jgi:hypothetical protein
MKKLLLLSALLGSFAGIAGASVLFSSCSAFEGENQASAINSNTCTVSADAGFHISQIVMTLTSDYSGYQNGTAPFPQVTLTYAYVLNTAGFGAIPTGSVSTSGTNSIPQLTFNPTVTGNFGLSASESFSLTNLVTGGNVTAVTGVMTLTATQTADVGGVPEPATLGLVGSALVGLAFFSRKKKRVSKS